MTSKAKPKVTPETLKISLGSVGANSVSPGSPRNVDRRPDTAPKPIQIRMPVEKHSEIKAYAAERQMSITDLLLEAYEEYRKNHK